MLHLGDCTDVGSAPVLIFGKILVEELETHLWGKLIHYIL